MNNLSKTILIFSIAILGASALGISVTQADNNNIEAQVWDKQSSVFIPCMGGVCQPLFSEDNFLPGDSAWGLFKVTNINSEEWPIGTEIIDYDDPSQLGDNFNLEILRAIPL